MSSGWVAVLIAKCVQLLSSRIKHAAPKNDNENSGTIAPEKISAWVTIIFGIAIMIGSMIGLFFQGSSVGGFVVSMIGVMMGGTMAGFMGPSITSIHEMSWDESGVTGPSKTFGPTLGRARTMIKWEDIIGTGETATQYWFIEAGDGRRIYWSYLYKGHRVFESMLSKHCPHIGD